MPRVGWIDSEDEAEDPAASQGGFMSTLHMRMATRLGALLLVAATAFAAHAQVPHYKLSAVPLDQAYSVNGKGQVLGKTSDQRKVIYDSRDGSFSYPDIPATARVSSLNYWGTIVGWDTDGGFQTDPYIYRKDGATRIDGLSEFFKSANKINNAGQVIGFSTDDYYYGWGFFKGRGSPLVVIGRGLPGVASSSANALNGKGEVAGVLYPDATSLPGTPYVYRKGSYTFLPDEWFDPMDINDNGVIVGYRSVFAQDRWLIQAAFYARGKVRSLQPLRAGDDHLASHINNGGRIVGYSRRQGKEETSRAVVYIDGRARDLNALTSNRGSVVLRDVIDLNEKGLILAAHSSSLGAKYYLLTPIP
jgi:hypothetical protein